MKFRSGDSSLSSAAGAGERHGQVNAHKGLQLVTAAGKKTPLPRLQPVRARCHKACLSPEEAGDQNNRDRFGIRLSEDK